MRPKTSPQVYVGGVPLLGQVLWGDLVITNRWPYGCWEVTFNVILKPFQRIPPLVAGVLIEVRMGSAVIWTGNLADPDWDTGAMRAVGAARQGETSLCLDGSGETTSVPDTIVDQAIARHAVDWIRRVSLSTSAFAVGDSTPNLNYVTAFMDAWSSAQGKRWGVNARREVYAAADPTVPSLYIRPGTAVLGVTEEQQAATVFGRYLDSGGNRHTLSVGAGVPEVGVSLFPHGVLDSTAATAIITGIRDQLQATTGWTNGFSVTADQVTSPGGQRVGLDRIVAGKMARLLGLRDPRGASAHTDVVLGESIWDVTAGTVQCNPVALDDRSISGIIEAAGGEAA